AATLLRFPVEGARLPAHPLLPCGHPLTHKGTPKVARGRGECCWRFALHFLMESAGQSRRAQAHRGKSGLRRAECQVTPGRREPTASATESRPPMARKGTGKGERVR